MTDIDNGVLSGYIINFGKYKNKNVRYLDLKELREYCEFLSKNYGKRGQSSIPDDLRKLIMFLEAF